MRWRNSVDDIETQLGVLCSYILLVSRSQSNDFAMAIDRSKEQSMK